MHAFMMAISKECETAAKRFTMLVNGQVRKTTKHMRERSSNRGQH
jgi:hypothetical protein